MRKSIIRRRIALLLIATATFVCYRMITIRELPYGNQYVLTHVSSSNESSSVPVIQACRHPDLDPNDPVIKKLYGQVSPITCDEEPDWVCLEPGRVKVCKHAIEKHKGVKCIYTFLRRKSDYKNTAGPTVKGGAAPVDLQSDYFRVKCRGGDNTSWENVMAGIRYIPTISTRAGTQFLPKDSTGLNVLIWGHDSLSRMTFMRTLPKSYKYLTEELNAIVLKSYNIVGDGTPQALIPIFTGRTERELPETRKRMPNANFVNVYPFIWKRFQDYGYVTSYAEDCPGIGAFTYRLRGFHNLPTDHYLRPFYIAAEKEFSKHKKLCLRGTPRHKVLMNWVEQFIQMYADKPRFSFIFHSELSHDNWNLISAIDDDLEEFLHQLKTKGHLNNTVLMVMSDHGHRFAKIRETQQGKQEERMPMVSFVFPPWFEKKYPIAMANFRENAQRLTTPFDIYSTLQNILHFEGPGIGSVKERGISLFKKIPLERTCADADIEPHWCACLDWETVNLNSDIIKRAALTLVQHINNLTESHRGVCEILTLDKIASADKFIPNKGLLQFLKNKDHDGFEADLSDKTTVSIEIYQIKIHTTPGDGHYEASLKFIRNEDKFLVKTSDISRVNKYGSQAACIADTQHHLRSYCYCKSQ